jgi:glycopeptide antibiotics resistance protein
LTQGLCQNADFWQSLCTSDAVADSPGTVAGFVRQGGRKIPCRWQDANGICTGYNSALQQFWLMRRGICNILLNVILFVPLGYLVPAAVRKIDSWWKMLIVGFEFTLIIETSQLILHRGMFDVDDLALNTLGAMIGWILYTKVLSPEKV